MHYSMNGPKDLVRLLLEHYLLRDFSRPDQKLSAKASCSRLYQKMHGSWSSSQSLSKQSVRDRGEQFKIETTARDSDYQREGRSRPNSAYLRWRCRFGFAESAPVEKFVKCFLTYNFQTICIISSRTSSCQQVFKRTFLYFSSFFLYETIVFYDKFTHCVPNSVTYSSIFTSNPCILM